MVTDIIIVATAPRIVGLIHVPHLVVRVGAWVIAIVGHECKR